MPGEASGELRRMFNFGPSLVQFGPAPVDLGWTAENVDATWDAPTVIGSLVGDTPVPGWRALEPLNPSCAAMRAQRDPQTPGVLARRPGEVEAKAEV
ncbi:uncharacterized protein PG986_004908 [Apiospora aurea]|uniref:Uncharacterized protein n=1 Tax=Apiospora aurea TaxID=335848 RepID=A0ABR1QG27_9PEZI